MSDKTEKQAITKAEVVNAIKTIREWCKSRDALENPCDGCPMDSNIARFIGRVCESRKCGRLKSD